MDSINKSTAGSCEQIYANVNWEELGFDLNPADYMFVAKSSTDGGFSGGAVTRYGQINLDPAAGILNYGQGVLEAVKAYRKEDGRILLFRPEENAARMRTGAERLCMPAPSVEQFLDAVKRIVMANKHWVPPPGKGSLYIRPLLIGTGPGLAPRPAPEVTFMVYANPVGNLHKASAPLSFIIQDKFHRTMPGGTGGIKSITNYSPVYKPIIEAKAAGFSDVLFLDAAIGKYIEEASSCNVFIVKLMKCFRAIAEVGERVDIYENIVSTAPTSDVILPGITRKSIIEIARWFEIQVEERSITVEEIMEADEVFCTGTAMGVAPVGSVTYQGKRSEYLTGEDTVTNLLRSSLVGIQTGVLPDRKQWNVALD